MRQQRFFFLALTGYWLVLCVFAWFSYSLTAPNLVLNTSPVYWQFQTWMWDTFFNNRPLLTNTFIALALFLTLGYGLVIKAAANTTLSFKTLFGVVCLIIFPLLFSSTALSYDVFNYIFNAKMVAVYHHNPHVSVALEFPNDPWIRFMHNTHTAAPYGYGWTVLSLIPYTLGMGKFLLTWLVFRAWSVLSIALLAGVFYLIGRDTSPSNTNFKWWLLVLFLNPLFLIEVISSAHNDLWMMAPALLSLWLVSRAKNHSLTTLALSALLLGASISTKLASLALAPLWIGLIIAPKLTKKFPSLIELKPAWPLAASMLMFVPLLTSRSQQFHPWYLTWAMVWLPVIAASNSTWPKHLKPLAAWWSFFVMILSITSLLRYVPYLSAGLFTPDILWHQKLITWSAVVLTPVMALILKSTNSVQNISK
jgi:hypothetical protein